MTPRPAAHRLVLLVGAALGVADLSACASGPPKPLVVAPAPAAKEAAPSVVTMAPIANPEREPPRERREPPPRSVDREPPRRVAPARPAPQGAPAPAAAPAPAPAPAERVDPAAAVRLRARGLEELNRGAVARAVVLLRQASRLDPGNAVIRRDLERAERINRAVHAPR